MAGRNGAGDHQVARAVRSLKGLRNDASKAIGALKDIERIVRFLDESDIFGAIEVDATDIHGRDVRDFLALAVEQYPQGVEVLVRARPTQSAANRAETQGADHERDSSFQHEAEGPGAGGRDHRDR